MLTALSALKRIVEKQNTIESGSIIISGQGSFLDISSLQKVPSQMNDSKRMRPVSDDESFGWFEDFEVGHCSSDDEPYLEDCFCAKSNKQLDKFSRVKSFPLAAGNDPPIYVLESSLSSQQLWYQTAGRRPRQPIGEREYFEQLWSKNFQESDAFSPPEEVIKNRPRKLSVTEDVVSVIYKGKGSHSNAVSKSFLDDNMVTITVQMPLFRVVIDSHERKHAEYLVIVSVDNVKFGVWRRSSHFKKLISQVIKNSVTYEKTIASWKCVTMRQRWFRCLDQQYLALKCFLLERVMHDLLFETDSP
eukprot:gene10839-22622_t